MKRWIIFLGLVLIISSTNVIAQQRFFDLGGGVRVVRHFAGSWSIEDHNVQMSFPISFSSWREGAQTVIRIVCAGNVRTVGEIGLSRAIEGLLIAAGASPLLAGHAASYMVGLGYNYLCD